MTEPRDPFDQLAAQTDDDVDPTFAARFALGSSEPWALTPTASSCSSRLEPSWRAHPTHETIPDTRGAPP